MKSVTIAILAVASLMGSANAAEPISPEGAENLAIVIRGDGGKELARVPLTGPRFAVSYRNSIYGTKAEERYVVLEDGSYRLVEIAADQLAVLEEYYAVPGAPQRANSEDRRNWVVPPNPAQPTLLDELSIAATDLGRRTIHVPGRPPLKLWPLVDDKNPFVVLDIEGNP